MKGYFKKIILVILLIVILLITGTTVFAEDDVYTPGDLTGSAPAGTMQEVKSIGNKVIGVLQAIGIVVSVIVATILGIKYMLGSIEQKAEYKKTMLPYVIGSALIFGASTISYIIINAVKF